MAEAVMIAAAVVSTTSTLLSAQQQAIGMRIQAQQAELQGRQGALNYNKQAIAVLDRQEQIRGAIRARAAAGGVNPDTGSPMTLQEISAEKAGVEFGMAKENAELAIYGGLAQSQSLQSGARAAEALGTMNALATAGTGYYRSQRVATPAKDDWWS
jgi:hypothetical protein